MNALLLSVLLAANAPDAAPPPPPPSSSVGTGTSTSVTLTEPTAQDRPFRAHLGVLAGVVMQKTQGEIGVAYDVARINKLVRLVADFTFGFRSTEMSLIPMGGVRFVLPIQSTRVEVWVAGLFGANITFLRGSTALSLPLRAAAGMHYRVSEKLAVGGEASVEVGPLIAPFVASYTAGHVTALAAWSF
jgi:hypothetical protein